VNGRIDYFVETEATFDPARTPSLQPVRRRAELMVGDIIVIFTRSRIDLGW
jgi:hypothetical protein